MKRQDTVSGYIHGLETKYKYEIPKEIIFVCILFYGNEVDEWDPKLVGQCTKLIGRTLIIDDEVKHFVTGSTFGKKIVKSGIFSWKFKVESIRDTFAGFNPMIGIWKVKNKVDKPPLGKFFTADANYNEAYAFDPGEAKLANPNGYFDSLDKYKYGKKCKKGTIIEMVLNLDELTLGYIIDGVDYGKAVDVVQGEYRAAVFICPGDSMTMLT